MTTSSSTTTSASTKSFEPGPSSKMSPSSHSNSAPSQSLDSFSSEIIRITCPVVSATYGNKLQCLLMNYVQGPLHNSPHCPREFFSPDSVTEELIHHKTVRAEHPIIYQYGLTDLPNLKHIEISIYVYKDTSATLLGRKHYRIDALAVCFNHDGWMIVGPSDDSCKGFLSFEWYNDRVTYTRDWDEMGFEEVLRLLKRAAKRNFDQYGALRSDEDKLKMDQELGNVFPARGSDRAPIGSDMFHKFVVQTEEAGLRETNWKSVILI